MDETNVSECEERRKHAAVHSFLAVMASGIKLPPLCIFKEVDNDRSRIKAEFTYPRLEYPQDLEYAVQEKAWNDASTMRKWIELVWRRFFPCQYHAQVD